MVAERLWREYRPQGWRPLPFWVGILATFHIVLLGWIFFRAATFGDAIFFLTGIFGGGASVMLTPMLLGLLLLGMTFHFMPRYSIQHVAMRVRALPAPAVGLAAGLLILIVDAMRPEGVAPFIYYQF